MKLFSALLEDTGKPKSIDMLAEKTGVEASLLGNREPIEDRQQISAKR
jgi:hypothetical protein